MITIRPVSDLRNKFADIEKTVNDGEPVFLTKNGYGSMVVMSIEAYSRMKQNVELALDEADDYEGKGKWQSQTVSILSDICRCFMMIWKNMSHILQKFCTIEKLQTIC